MTKKPVYQTCKCGSKFFREDVKATTTQEMVRVLVDTSCGPLDYEAADSVCTLDGSEEWDTRELVCMDCSSEYTLSAEKLLVEKVELQTPSEGKKLIVKASIYHDWVDSFDHVVIDLTSADIAHIHHLHSVARIIGGGASDRVSLFDPFGVLTFKSDEDAPVDNGRVALVEPEDDEARVECVRFNIESDGEFWWSGYIRHSDPAIEWESSRMPISVLAEPGDYDERDEPSGDNEYNLHGSSPQEPCDGCPEPDGEPKCGSTHCKFHPDHGGTV